MKNIILSVFAFLTFAVINAQEVKYALKGGLNIASLIDGENGYDARGGFHIGGLVELKLSEKFYIQPELLFSQQGTKGKFSGFVGSSFSEIENTIKYDYLNIPVMLKFYITKEFSVLAGPQIGFLLTGKSKIKVDSVEVEVDAKDELNKVDFGCNFGVGYDFTKNIFAEARYNLGFTEIAKEDNVLNGRNEVIQISVGYKF